jgi:hypothetical protein
MNMRDGKSEEGQKSKLFREQILTVDDLEVFKNNLLLEMKKMAKELLGSPGKKWLKSYEVKKLLSISPGTLQNLRVNGTLPYTKIGSVILYDYDDIQKMLSAHRKQ